MFRLSKNQNGFTLIEILIAITLLSILMVGVISLVDNSTTTKERITREDREFLQVQAAIDRIKIDFTQIYSPLYFESIKKSDTELTQLGIKSTKTSDQRDASPTENINDFQKSEKFVALTHWDKVIPALENPEPTTLIFLTTSNKRRIENSKQSKYAWVKFSLRKSAAKNLNKDAPYELVRSYAPEGLYQKEFDWDKVPELLLLKNISKIKYEFWKNADKKWATKLEELGKTERYKIRGLRITLNWIDTDNLEQETSRIFIPNWPPFDTQKDLQERLTYPETKNKNAK